MKMHRMIMSAAVAAAVCAISPANAELEVTGAAGVDVASVYVFRGATISDEVQVQPTIEATIAGLLVGTWGTFDTDAEQFTEIDYYLSYDLPLGDDSPVAASLGFTEYTYPYAGAAMTEADREINIGLSAEAPLDPTLSVNVGIDGAIDEMTYLELGLAEDVEVSDDVTVGLSLALGYVADAPDGGETGMSHATVTASTAVGPGTLSVSYVGETDDDVLEVDEDVVIALGVAF